MNNEIVLEDKLDIKKFQNLEHVLQLHYPVL